MALILLRHPPLLGAEGYCYGRSQPGVVDDTALGRALAGLQGFCGLPVSSSPSPRCLALAQRLSSAVCIEPALQELDFGTWEGCRWDDISRTQLDDWAADIWHYPPGGGESARQLQARWQRLRLRWRADGEPLRVVVTHAGVIRMALAEAGLIAEADRWSSPIQHLHPYWLEAAP